jgi:putative glutamine amidotransferase
LRRQVLNHEAIYSRWQTRPRCVVGILCADDDARAGTQGQLGPYIRALIDAGAQPKLLYASRGTVQKQMERVDALLVPGGHDVDASSYNQSPGPGMAGRKTNAKLDQTQIDYIQYALQNGTPMLGICRGMQIMNVAGGGTLCQDIPTEHPGNYGVHLNHCPPNGMGGGVHMIGISGSSRLRRLLDSNDIWVNSVHHQCVATLSPLFEVAAISLDGVFEAMERKGNPTQMAVQFHPETARDWQGKFNRLFDYLVSNGERMRVQRFQVQPAAPPPEEEPPVVVPDEAEASNAAPEGGTGTAPQPPESATRPAASAPPLPPAESARPLQPAEPAAPSSHTDAAAMT